MRRIRSFQQLTLFDRWDWLDAARRLELDRSWPKALQSVLYVVPAEAHARLFHPSMGRPSKESVMVVGLLVLQQMFDLTDQEAVDRLRFDLRFQYGLDVLPDAATIGLRTLERARASLLDLGDEIFVTTTDRLIKALGVDTRMQRTDSTLVQSNIRKLARYQLFVRCLRGVLRDAARCGRAVPAELMERYEGRKGEWFGDIKPSVVAEKLAEAAEDVWSVLALFRGDVEVSGKRSYRLLKRLFDEQCELALDGERLEVGVKEKLAKEDRAGRLVNPADPEASFDGHRRQVGHQLQVTETCGQGGEAPDLITRVDVEPVNTTDLATVEKVHRELEGRGIKPVDHLCDAGYASDETIQASAQDGVRLTTPVRGRKPEDGRLSLLDFAVSEDARVIERCPAGQVPCRIRVRPDVAITSVWFDAQICRACPHLGQCPVELRSRAARVSYKWKKVRTARRRQACDCDEALKKRYALRAGIEATMSHLKNRRGLRRLRRRGRASVRFTAFMGALAENLWRVAQHLARARTEGVIPGGIPLRSTGFSAAYASSGRILAFHVGLRQTATATVRAAWPHARVATGPRLLPVAA